MVDRNTYMIKKLSQLWEQNPTLRFGQLLDFVSCNAEFDCNEHIFFIGDGTMSRILTELTEKYPKK